MTSSQHTESAPEIPDFGDGKDAGALRTIGEVTSALGIKQHVLRYWEEQFPNLRPLTRAGGRRYYRPADIALIMRINRLLHHEGYTIKGAKQALNGGQLGERGASGGKPGGPAVAQPDVQGTAPDESGPKTAYSDSARPLIEFIASIRDRLAAAIEG